MWSDAIPTTARSVRAEEVGQSSTSERRAVLIVTETVKVNETSAGVTFTVRVQPRARRNAIVGEFGDALKVALAAPPVDGKANAACIRLFAEALNLPRASVAVASGHASRNKVIRVRGITAAECEKRLQSNVR